MRLKFIKISESNLMSKIRKRTIEGLSIDEIDSRGRATANAVYTNSAGEIVLEATHSSG